VTAVGNLDPKFQPAYLTYSTLWTRRHYDESRAFFEGLLTGPDSARVYVMAFDQLTHNLQTLPWMEVMIVTRPMSAYAVVVPVPENMTPGHETDSSPNRAVQQSISFHLATASG